MKIHSKKKINILATVFAIICSTILPGVLSGCEKSSTIGSEMVSEEVTVVVDSSFTISSQSVEVPAVVSRTVAQLIGIIDAPDFGYISSDVVTQFMPVTALDTAGVTVNDIDSLKLNMLIPFGGYVGDSVAFMGMEVYPLTKQLSAPIYSNFNPEGYYDPSNLLGSTVYNLTKAYEPDSLQKNEYYTVSVDLPLDLGKKFFNEYVESPATYSSPITFSQFFPGIYIKNSYGSGRITRISNSSIEMYYHAHAKNSNGNDTTYLRKGTYLTVTPEIITNNDITLQVASTVKEKIAQGQSVLLAPAGYEVEIRFPAPEIIATFRGGTEYGLGVVNTLSFEIPLELIENKYDIGAPENVLFVLKKERDDFFLQNKLNDNVTSYLATLIKLKDGSYGYTFSDMRQFIVDLIAKEELKEEDYTFMLVPVTVSTETNSDYYGNYNSTISALIPYVTEPKMARILSEKVKINFVYTRQTTNF